MPRTEIRPFYRKFTRSYYVQIGRKQINLGRDKRVVEICTRLCLQHPTGPIFRNTKGHPWTKNSIGCRLQSIKGKVGINDLCAYGIRHTYATDGLLNGVDSVVLAELMGHKDHTMVAKTYQHVAKNLSFLREAAKQAKRQDVSKSDS